MKLKLSTFLADETFEIPAYQRDYSWGHAQVEDLIKDIDEVVRGQPSHYLGTFVLSRADDHGPFEIVDGQQRLTTLVLVVTALLKQLPEPKQTTFAAMLTRDVSTDRLKLHFGVNNDFAVKLLNDDDFSPRPRNDDERMAGDSFALTGGRRRLADAYQLARDHARDLYKSGGTDRVKRWIEAIKKMEVMQFIERDTGHAIRIFQTINDRGLALSAMDKAKALLIYYSNRYLGGELDEAINDRFGRCFVAFDCVKELVRNERYRVDHIYRADFLENEILQYHYLAYDYREIVGGGQFRVSDRTVLDGLLKQTMQKHCRDVDELRSFIDDYTRDLAEFFGAFHDLVERIRTSPRLYKLFVVLGFSTKLYPLLIRLHQRGILEQASFDGGPDLLKCLEICDMRVYKIGGSNAASEIGKASGDSHTKEPREIADWLRWITNRFMPNGRLRHFLMASDFGHEGLKYQLIEYDEDCRRESYSLAELKDLVGETITREHVLPSDPGLFDVRKYCFKNGQDYREHVNQLGNVLALTSKENSRCRNRSPDDKMTAEDLYKCSTYCSTRQFARDYDNGGPFYGEDHGVTFHKAHLIKRTKRLAEWVMKRWCLWEYAPESPTD